MDTFPTQPQSNESIVEELTKDITESCIIEPCYSINMDKAIHSSLQINKDENNFTQKSQLSETKNIVSEEAVNIFFVDNIKLKIRDQNLSEEEKKNFKIDAEKFKLQGNTLFHEENYLEAAIKYTDGLKVCPLIYNQDRAVLFANRAAAIVQTKTHTDLAIADCSQAVELYPSYVKAYLRRAHLYEKNNNLEEALEDYKKVLSFDLNHKESIFAIKKLEPMIHEKNEKLKAEMLDNLKGLGNAILRPFGLSTENFKMQKDEATGNYSINFQK